MTRYYREYNRLPGASACLGRGPPSAGVSVGSFWECKSDAHVCKHVSVRVCVHMLDRGVWKVSGTNREKA